MMPKTITRSAKNIQKQIRAGHGLEKPLNSV
jgi:hypothetical protein